MPDLDESDRFDEPTVECDRCGRHTLHKDMRGKICGWCADERNPDRDQPLPTQNDAPYIQELVIADIQERLQHGIRKYGTGLQPFNGRSMLQDLYEELLDAAVYVRGKLEEERLSRDQT